MKKIITLIFVLTVAVNTAYPQTTKPVKKYTKTELNQDLDSLQSYLIQTHPNPFSVISKVEFDKKIIEIKARFDQDLTLKEYYRLIAPLVASIADGHTAIRYAGNKFTQEASPLFPYIAKLSNQAPQIVVNGYVYDTLAQIPNGAEILSINGINSQQIIDKIIANTSGESNEYRLKTASNVFLGSLLFTYFDLGDSFEVKYKIDQKIIEKRIPAIRLDELNAVMRAKKKTNTPQVNVPNFSLKLDKSIGTAIIDFRYFNDEDAFKVFLDSTFRVIKNEKIQHLIIDIRENGGGNSQLGDQLLSYIAKNKFTQFGKTIVKYSQPQKNFFEQICKQDSSNCEMYQYLKTQQNGKVETFENNELISPNKTIFGGKVYLLTSLKTFSSASTFAQCFKHYKLGTIIGQETGGWIVAYGDKITTNLPITNLTLFISQKKFYTIGSTDKDLHGIVPDIKTKSEEALDFTLKKIRIGL